MQVNVPGVENKINNWFGGDCKKSLNGELGQSHGFVCRTQATVTSTAIPSVTSTAKPPVTSSAKPPVTSTAKPSATTPVKTTSSLVTKEHTTGVSSGDTSTTSDTITTKLDQRWFTFIIIIVTIIS